jgi:hypothetical protein
MKKGNSFCLSGFSAQSFKELLNLQFNAQWRNRMDAHEDIISPRLVVLKDELGEGKLTALEAF